ncbi:MAG: isoleucine--tRNA ligase [Promethearchaeota archaeon]
MKPLGKLDSLEIEERIQQWWEEQNIYSLIKKNEPKDKKFFFLDGPPYTTGDVHLGTAYNKILKDYVIKYKRMQGYRVTDTPGYDTHGLPIEVIIEKKLGIKNKQEIFKFGLDNFVHECKTYALSQIGTMNKQFARLGCNFWNWDNPYVTLESTYIQGVWWTIKKAWENGYLYKGFRPQNCCPRCGTALAKHEFEYHDITDTAIFVKFQSVDDPNTYFVIWTTTPWTLISNTNIMANPDVEYVKMKVKDEYWIMATAATSDLLQNKLSLVVNAEDGFSYGERYTGYDLEGKRYIHPFADEVPLQAEMEKEQPLVHTIVLSREYVQESGGSGLVHSAPGHGPEDFEVGMEYGIPIFSPVDMDGLYTEEAGEHFKGKYVHEVNREIIDMLIEKGTLVNEEAISHEYAHCWRCQTKLVYRATDQWFFAMSKLRDELLKENEEIFWIPKYSGDTNFKSWLMSLRDWCISRQRIWGIPLSIWICDDEACENMDVIGSMKELEEKAGECPDDLHVPIIDKVTWQCPKCKKGTMRRVPDLADVWLDSGSVMWASQQFVDGHEHYDTWEPADFILEGKDQIRGWFNSLISAAILSSKRRNYNACYMHGFINSHGVKMSKSLGNSVQPIDLMNGEVEILSESQKEHMRKQAALLSTSKFDKTKEIKPKKKNRKERKKKFIKDDKRWSNIKGIENFRFYCVMAAQPGKDMNFDYKEYTDTFKVLNTFWNTYLFAQEKMQLNKFDPNTHTLDVKKLSAADKWMVSKINTTIKDVTELFEEYELPSIPARLQEFIVNDLSRWYIALIRDDIDVNNEDPNKYNTLAVLWYVLHKLLLMMAPVNPMLTEDIYQKMFRPMIPDQTRESIHMDKWPKVEKKMLNGTVEQQMQTARNIIDEVRSLKTENKIKLRWPTKGLLIKAKEIKDTDDKKDTRGKKDTENKIPFQDLIREMSNVKELTIIGDEKVDSSYKSKDIGNYVVYLDLEDSKELQQERILRDLLRTIQFLRKANKLQTGESITLTLSTDHSFLYETLDELKDAVIAKVTADPLNLVNTVSDTPAEGISHDFHVCLNGKCFAVIRDKMVNSILEGKDGKCNYCNNPISKENMGLIQIHFVKN